jgi:catechol 2,3-dioxygenase-like lactoylglutathione lyase family enzyme
MDRPPMKGMHHLALYVQDMEKAKAFYVDCLGLHVEWQPDDENAYLTSGSDNLAIHKAPKDFDASTQQHLDHFGFILQKPDEVDAWYAYLNSHDVPMKSQVKDHRDGARSFYCADPDGVVIQFIYHPPLA